MQPTTMVMKADDVFMVTDEHGSINDGVLGTGLYFRDTRFLSQYQMSLNGQALELLDSSAGRNDASIAQFTNSLLPTARGQILPHTVGVRRSREIERGLVERLEVQSFNDFAVTLELDLVFGADFRDIFDIRGFRPAARGQVLLPIIEETGAVLRYRAHDAAAYATEIHFTRRPDEAWIDAGAEVTAASNELETILPGYDRLVRQHQADRLAFVTLRFRLELPSHGQERLEFRLTPSLQPTEVARPQQPTSSNLVDEAAPPRDPFTVVETGNDLLNRALDRSLRDIRTLITPFPDGLLIAAGIPWYTAPFGRDSLIAALQLLLFSPEIAVETLRYLARLQGTVVDDWTEEEPGKILHEQRFGEMARIGEVPHTPYYGTIDATPLFVILFAELMRWTGDRAVFDELYPAVERAIGWIDRYGDSDGDGFVDYGVRSREGLVNQSWKDSDNSLQFPDGGPIIAPIAAIEVQGYVYYARRVLADVLDSFGLPGAAEQRSRAEVLRERFEEHFWIPEAGCYGQAIDGSGTLVPAISSNPGHCLWSGIVDPDRAAQVVERLTAPDLYSGWGIRTLSANMPAYNPMSYHNGSVWPHDNVLIAAGFKRYGAEEALARVFGDLLDAASHFAYLRLPELFCGFRRDAERISIPVAYPVSCSPQAWAAGALPYLLTAALGIEPNAAQRRLLLRPYLPDWLPEVRLRGLRFAGQTLDLRLRGRGRDVELEAEPGEIELRLGG